MALAVVLAVLFGVVMVGGLVYMHVTTKKNYATYDEMSRELERRTTIAKVSSVSMFAIGVILVLVFKAEWGTYISIVCLTLILVALYALITTRHTLK